MSERLIEKLDRFGAEAGIKEMTPEIRRFAMLVRNDMLQVWPKREWVGLTIEEMNEMTWGKTVYEILALAEAKLREKNT
jgi:hypothetical protein